MNRRDLLRALAATGVGHALSALGGWRAPEWTAEEMLAGHRLRDEPPPEAGPPERHYDVVVVGGGLAGLTAAYELRDRSLLLLDKEPQVGGHARAAEWNGVRYSLAAAYLTEPYAPLEGFYRRAGLLDALLPIAEPVDQLARGAERWEPLTRGAGAARLRKELSALAGKRGAPTIPVERSAEWALRLDRFSLADYLKEKRYGEEAEAYVRLYCRSAFSSTPEALSAFAGLNFLMGEVGPRYTYPGGTAGAAERLAAEVQRAGSGRLVRQALVRRVVPQGPKPRVVYQQGETLHTVSAEVVVFAAPLALAPRVVDGLPPAQTRAIAAAPRGGVLVANLCLEGGSRPGAYDTWYQGAGTDVVCADWVVPEAKRSETARVLTVYCSVGTQRARLLGESAAQWAERLVDDVEGFLPGTKQRTREVRLSRFGHAFIAPPPGYLTGARTVARRPLGRVLFAHSEAQGLPAFESAVWEGLRASEQARALLRKR